MPLNFDKIEFTLQRLETQSVFKKISKVVGSVYSFVHIPSKRFDLSYVILSLFRPNNFFALLTPEIKQKFLSDYKIFKKWYEKKFHNKSPHLKVIEVSSPSQFDFEILSEQLHKNIFLKHNKKILVDVTGGTKLHSILLYNLAIQYGLTSVYLYTHEIANNKSLNVFPGEEKLYFFNYKTSQYKMIDLTQIFEIFVTQTKNFINLNFTLDNKNYKKAIPISKFTQINQMSFFSVLIENMKTYRILKFYFDKETYLYPIDSIFREKMEIATFRDFRFDYDKRPFFNPSIEKNILILVAPLTPFEEKSFFDEAKSIEKNMILSGYSATVASISSVRDFKKWTRKHFDIIHCIGHSDIDKKGMFYRFSRSKLYASDIAYIKTHFFFSNSCNSGDMGTVKVKDSFAYMLLKNNVKTYIGTMSTVETNLAKKFAIAFYKNSLNKPLGENFYQIIMSNDLYRKSYLFYGNVHFAL